MNVDRPAGPGAACGVECCGMVGRSPVMQRLFTLIRRLAPHVRIALITGETGVGKELVAHALHQLGPRRECRFVAVSCSTITDTLFESQFFGHAKGAFTGAIDNVPGVFESADRGTLFLDEISALSLTGQAKLVRVLETGEVRRVGAVASRRVDVQILAATNRNLKREIERGHFRADLLYRLNVVEIEVPPLRDRREDILSLTAAFVREISATTGKPLIGTTPGAERRLLEAPWKGNVRELRNTIERAGMLAAGEFITERDLSGSALLSGATRASPLPQPADGMPLFELERRRIVEVLQRTGGNKLSAARLLGLSRRALYRRLERYGIGSNAIH
ncbi:MAG: sigma-54-dependent Fis family transcriptional regulator [Acidobacteria bacterium]|nr:sigma-54-dependent Fis family transcriptional regulator [Acidobacteriota bacterium]